MSCEKCNDRRVFEEAKGPIVAMRLCSCVEDCESCRGQGETVEEDPDTGYERLVPCRKCLKVKTWARCFNLAQIPARLLGATLDRYDPKTEEQIDARQRMRRFVVSWRPNAPGMLLCGPTGSGKTHLACAAIRAITCKGVRARVITQTQVMEGFKDRMDRDGLKEAEWRMYLRDVPLLVLDELEPAETPWQRERITDLLEARYAANTTTICTTNVLTLRDPESPEIPCIEDLFGENGQRVVSRLVEMCPPVAVVGPDHRLVLADRRARGVV